MIPFALLGKKAGELLAPVAAKLASPLVKWGIIIAILVISNLWTWHKTTLTCEKDKAEAIAIQAAAFSKQQAAVMVSREEALKQLDVVRREKDQKIIDIQKRLVTYERNAKKSNVPVPPDSVGMFNAISGLLPPANDVPGADTASRKSDELSEARIEVTRLLLAYVRAYADCGGELKSLWDVYDSLTRVIRTDYRIQTGE